MSVPARTGKTSPATPRLISGQRQVVPLSSHPRSITPMPDQESSQRWRVIEAGGMEDGGTASPTKPMVTIMRRARGLSTLAPLCSQLLNHLIRPQQEGWRDRIAALRSRPRDSSRIAWSLSLSASSRCQKPRSPAHLRLARAARRHRSLTCPATPDTPAHRACIKSRRLACSSVACIAGCVAANWMSFA